MPYIDKFLSSLPPHSFHMPGHKRNGALFPSMPLSKDITEIKGADNLHNPKGIIKDSMDEAARLWKTKRSFYLVNGSTCGILAGLATLCKRGDKVLVARNCHRSVFHGIELLGLSPIYVLPEYIQEIGVYGAVSPQGVKDALERNSGIKALVITSPSYEGVISDVKEISALCKKNGVKLMADEAHGAHLDLSPYFTGGSILGGADISVQSLHKTLPALTQTAILHVNSDEVDVERLMHKLRVFETSSPSYLLMQSAEHSVETAKNQALFKRWHDCVTAVEEKTAGFKKLKTALKDYRRDPSKLVFTGVDGIELGELMRKHNVEPELVSHSHIIAMTGMGNTHADYKALMDALEEAERTLNAVQADFTPPAYCYGNAFCGIEEALDAPSVALPPKACVGRIAAEYVWAYPPGVPLLIPGESINEAFLSSELENLESDSGLLPKLIKVLC